MRTFIAAAVVTAVAAPALAHTDPSAHGSALTGLAHPILGTDHLLAMVAVGLLAATQGTRSAWALPAAFVGSMALGIALGAAGLAVPFAEPLILASIFVLAVLLAWAARLPLGAASAMVAIFGLAHGSAHGLEMGSASALPYAAGVLAATALLHAAGLGLGSLLMRHGPALRLVSAVLGLGAVGLALG